MATVAFVQASDKCLAEAPVKEWFPAYNSSRSPMDWSKNPPGWGACHEYSRATCCEKNHTDVITRVTLLMSNAGFSPTCQHITEQVLCALGCNPDVGTGAVQPVVCRGTCDMWFNACKDEFITPPANSVYRLPITPCLDSSLVCSQIKDMFPMGAQEFCHVMSVTEVTTATGECLPLQADSKRIGMQLPKPIFTPSKGSPRGVIDAFVQDLRRFIQPIVNWYVNHVDKLVKRHPGVLMWFGIVTLVFISFPVLVALWTKVSKRGIEQENDDF